MINPSKMIHGLDPRSIGMCFATIILKVWSDFSVNEAGAFVAMFAGLTTIVYNIYRIQKEIRNK